MEPRDSLAHFTLSLSHDTVCLVVVALRLSFTFVNLKLVLAYIVGDVPLIVYF